VRQEKLETRRKALEHWAWGRDFRHQAWKKEREYKREIDRLTAYDAGHSYGATLVALDVLYKDLNNPGLEGAAPVALEPEVLQNINFKVLGGNVGLIRQDRVPWPLVLMDDQFANDREEVERLLLKVKQMARDDQLSARYPQLADTLKELRDRKDNLKTRVIALVKQFSPDEYIQARRLVGELEDTIKALSRPEEATFLLKGLPGCKTVPDLVRNMAEQGLRFADAVEGRERYYFILHDALARQSKLLHGAR
jgi:hypothetical protein